MEEKLLKDLKECCAQVLALTGQPSTRLLNNLAKDGAIKTAKRMVKSNRPSDTFDLLAEKRLLAHSVEAIFMKGCYSVLFTDEEADTCLERLVECGFYTL